MRNRTLFRKPLPIVGSTILALSLCLICEVLSSVEDIEKRLAAEYTARGVTLWIWNPEMFCKIKKPDGYTFQTASIRRAYILLEKASCSPIVMEVLDCEFDRIQAGIYLWRKASFVSGLQGEILSVGRSLKKSECKDSDNSIVINKNAFDDEPQTAAKYFRTVFDQIKSSQKRKRSQFDSNEGSLAAVRIKLSALQKD